MLGADDLAHQNRARRPFAAEAEALQAAHDQQLAEQVRQPARGGEERVPHYGNLQHPYATVPSARMPVSHPPRAEVINALLATMPASDWLMLHCAVRVGIRNV
jgi:hypothetical protein